MQKIRRKIIAIFISIIILMITTVSFTYAWLSANHATYLTNLNVEVSTGEGISLSVDGLNYSSTISESSIEEAIVMKYLGYSYDDDNMMIDSEGNSVDLTDTEIEEYFSDIAFKPVTTMDGTNYYGDKNNLVSSSVESGRYIQFDLYIKATDSDDTCVYFNNSDYNYDSDGNLYKNTEITSDSITSSSDETDSSYLYAGLTTIDSSGNAEEINAGSTDFTVSAKDAMRFSTNIDGDIKIFEPNIGTGSYATNLDSSNYNDLYLDASYLDSSKNAAFTYTNNLEDVSSYSPLDYSDIPVTYKDFNSLESDEICELETVDSVQKVTFTYWLEGWDSDCIDGLVDSTINISLAFTTNSTVLYELTKEVNYYNGDEVTTFNYYDYDAVEPYLPYNSDGKTFEGWYTDDSYTEEFDFDKIDDSLTTSFDVYALWK